MQFIAFELGRPYFVVRGRSRRPRRRAAPRVRSGDEGQGLLADADKLNQEVNPFTGEEMQKMLADVYATPKALIARLAEATKSKPDLKVLEGEKRRREERIRRVVQSAQTTAQAGCAASRALS